MKKHGGFMGACSALAFAACAAGGAQAQVSVSEGVYFTDLIVFGDSLSDPGNLPGITGQNQPPPPYFQNRFSSGPVSAELFPELLGFSATRGLNFAVGGAQFGTANNNPLLNGTGISAQVSGFLATNPTVRDTDLVQLFGGANNYFSALPTIATTPPADVPAVLTATVNDTIALMANDAARLRAAGVQQFLLPNLPNLGATPLFASIGQPELGANFTLLHNAGVSGIAADLNDSGAIAYILDVSTINADIIANPAKYGFNNVTEPCFNSTTFAVCTDSEDRLFFDDVHPSGRAHAIFAAASADTLLAPRTISAQTEVSMSSARAFTNSLRGLMNQGAFDGEGGRLFATVGFNDVERGDQSYAVGYSGDEISLIGGYVHKFGEGVTAGIAGQYADGETDLTGGLGSFDVTGWRGSVFAGGAVGPLELRGMAMVGLDQLEDITRITGVVNQIAVGETDLGVTAAEFEAALPLQASEVVTLAPFARVVLERASSQQYDETGAVGLNQRVFAVNLTRSDVELGARGAAKLAALTLSGDVAYVAAIEDPQSDVATALISAPGAVRTLPGATLSTDYVRFAGDVSFDLTPTVRLSVGGIGATGQDENEEVTGFVRLSRAIGQ